MTEITLPSMRVRLIKHLADLAASPAHEDQWVQLSPSGKRGSPLLDFLIHFLFDDTPLAENATAQVGTILVSDDEAHAVQKLTEAIDQMLIKYEKDRPIPSGEYFYKPEWNDLVAAAKRALSTMEQRVADAAS